MVSDATSLNSVQIQQVLLLLLGVESYLSRAPDGTLGVTGEGSMLDNAAGE